jgi:hypothetical protein
MGFPPMAERIQLKDPGSELVMYVSGCKAEVVEKNDYFLFGDGKKELLVPQSSVHAQLERLGIASAQFLIGKHVRFGRSMKMSRANKPYWDIDWAKGNGSGAEPISGGEGKAGNSVSPPLADSAKKPTMREAYKQLTQWVIDEIAPIYAEDQWSMTAADIAACTATLFIQACQSGKVE